MANEQIDRYFDQRRTADLELTRRMLTIARGYSGTMPTKARQALLKALRTYPRDRSVSLRMLLQTIYWVYTSGLRIDRGTTQHG